jgi:carbon-monoxide dehydrogenase small subunit
MRITLRVNDATVTRDVEPRLLLSAFLRDHLRLTGTHVGCETSLCGACTVLVDGRALKACTRLAVQCDGQEITTVEGLEQNGVLHPVQTAFREKHGLQCGFCTPGMMLVGCELVERGLANDEESLRHGLAGNLCRCTGYQHIVDALLHAGGAR